MLTKASDIVAAVDEVILQLVNDGASSKTFMGKSYSIIDLDKLMNIRKLYVKIMAEETPTTSTIPIVSNADFSSSDNDYSTRAW
jgi:hypothetical protein